MNDGSKCPHGCGQTLAELARGAPHARGCPSTADAKLRAEIAAAWAALGIKPEDAADDPETATLDGAIRVSLQYERDRVEDLRRIVAKQRPPQPRLGVVPLVAVDNRLVLGKRAKGVNAGKWILPGGGVEFLERLHEAGVREFLEETGMRIEINPDENPITVMQIIGRATHRVCLVIPAKALDPLSTLRPSDELSEVRSFTLDELQEIRGDMTAPVRNCLEKLGFLRESVVESVAGAICIACAGQPDDEPCTKSKRSCGHHCNHTWEDKPCCWCGAAFKPETV